MPTLKITNSALMNAQGLDTLAKQGAIADSSTTQFSITAVTITGNAHRVANTLATATVVTAFDDDDDFPTDFDYLHFWADVDMYIQIIAGTSRAIFKVLAKVPFVLPGYDAMLADAASTLIAGGTEPTLVDIDSIVIGNYSGGTGNYILTIFD